MSDDETVRARFYRHSVEYARESVVRNVGAPTVSAIEALGYRVVPAWVTEMIEKILSKA